MTASLTPDADRAAAPTVALAPRVRGIRARGDATARTSRSSTSPSASATVTAVDRMDLRIARGEFYSLLGPSGCGKTTTLRMIAGFEQPTEGEILLAGQPIAGVPPYQRNVNTVFQHYALFPHMDVARNVGYGLRQRQGRQGRGGRGASARPSTLVRLRRLRAAPDLGAVGRPAAARRAGPGPRQPAHRAPARRAARRARPEAAQGDAARAQGAPARGRHHVRLRDPRPGGGAHDERRHRGHARRPDPADGRPDRAVRAAGQPLRRRLHRHLELPAGHGRFGRPGEPARGDPERSRASSFAGRSRTRRPP